MRPREPHFLFVLFLKTAVQIQKTGVGLPIRAQGCTNRCPDAKTGAKMQKRSGHLLSSLFQLFMQLF
jgi:hypothetical protein